MLFHNKISSVVVIYSGVDTMCNEYKISKDYRFDGIIPNMTKEYSEYLPFNLLRYLTIPNITEYNKYSAHHYFASSTHFNMPGNQLLGHDIQIKYLVVDVNYGKHTTRCLRK